MPVSNTEQIKKIVILLIIFAIIWQIYNYTYRARYGDFLKNIKIADVPHSVKCFFNEPGCEEGDIDGWAIVHGLMFFIIGLIVPNQYLAVIVISIIFEIVQPYLGNKARYILNPLINLTGYAIGSILSNAGSFEEKYKVLID
ncbi:hypothetical protein QJ856_gp0522 [Tupanvirus deep ocean]|uniref:Uncharacterized protein n=2 Tax=Tupanvirus TaxID=2094720 RepID=A0AC62A911_9VIRU|nr:hypothetical protein QJ856_gp0522 [Tupanvirus deep ocean]QKU34224.1 hypothetical protein [Tupanvirus deep ocean]